MNSSFGVDSFRSGDSRGGSQDLHVSGRNKGIREIDLNFALAEPEGSEDADDSGLSEENAMLLASITSLDLSRNEIECLSNLEALKALRTLDASYNLIYAIHRLPFTLTRLNLSHNRLRDLDGVARLPHLRELDIRANRLANLAGFSPRMPLQVLHADDNRLVSTLGLEDMPDLRILSLANNFIERLDELAFLSNAVSLQALTLKNNPVTQVNGYRMLVGQRQAALLSLDGAPLLRPRSDTDYRESYKTGTLAASSSFQQHKGGNLSAVQLPHASRNGTTGGTGSRVSSATSAHVTPVRRASEYTSHDDRQHQLQQHQASPGTRGGESPLFDDTFLRGMYAATEAVQNPLERDMQRRQHPYAANHQMGSEPTLAKRTDSSIDSLATPVAERQAPQPTQETGGRGGRAQPAAGDGYAHQFRAARAAVGASAAFDKEEEESHAESDPSHSQASGEKSRHSLTGRPRPAASKVSSRGPALTAVSALSNAQADDHRHPVARLHDCLVAKEQLEKENQTLRGRLRKSEELLAEARRIVSEQLNDLSSTRVERDALRQSDGDAKERLERAKRHTRMIEDHHREEVAALQEQFERAKTFYEAQLADMRRQLAVEMARGTTAAAGTRKVAAQNDTSKLQVGDADAPPPLPSAASRTRREPAVPTSTPTPRPSALTAMTLPPFPMTPCDARKDGKEDFRSENERGDKGEAMTPVSSSAAVDTNLLADQLKGWLYSQMADDISRAEQEDLHRRLQRSLEMEEAEKQTALQKSGAPANSNAFPLESTEKMRELLEAYVLQQQEQPSQPQPLAKAAPMREADEKTENNTNATSRSPNPADPHKESVQERKEPFRNDGGHSPAAEPFVSRARPALSPQKKW